MTTRERYISSGLITPRPTPLTLPELVARGFFAAVKAKLGNR